MIYCRLMVTNKTQETNHSLGDCQLTAPMAKLLDLHNLREENFARRFPMISRILRIWWPTKDLWCYPVYCELSWYGSRYGSAGFSKKRPNFLSHKEKFRNHSDSGTFIVAEAGLELTASEIWLSIGSIWWRFGLFEAHRKPWFRNSKKLRVSVLSKVFFV